MTALIILFAIAAVLVIQTVRAYLHDGSGPAQPPRSHFEDPRFQAPSLGS